MAKLWDWMRGTLKREVPILTAMEPFIKVKPPQKKRFEYIDEEAGDGTKLRGRKAKGRAKHRAKMGAHVEAADPPEVADLILVLRRLESVGLDIPYLIFSAVGVTALFSCIYSEDVSPDINAFNFEQPVIDFVVAADGLIWGGSKGTSETAPELWTSIYLALTALLKNNEVEHDPMDREAVVDPEDGELSVLANVPATRPESEERSTKRAKSEHDESTDVVMGEVS
ncbi:hypothetical protein C8J57DRAFT_1350142 [Mycena rebaudengoi]|nr:hypothetical protein C8J57DRAFT_1350142 [Mycena rebaudengoi]